MEVGKYYRRKSKPFELLQCCGYRIEDDVFYIFLLRDCYFGKDTEVYSDEQVHWVEVPKEDLR